ncbi:Gfo/Idh/MocA family oxidoreductase [Rahnella aquatilis]|uniref:Gfo/Idh/MocA family protein n=1 Tax=Rahnella sp. (strain Y9602) TaxID=2703885 RepID=A0ABW6C7Y9_RAHSY|nr:Gfo/Idh/MocA family oxidoreductase [Rahnella sp. NRRL B-41462]AYA06144.1 gfo/Idh/MocA family oxidoreductase [Rahnella aquatilis]AZP44511.1 Gfo/Idh/MocA family oxidoreductase [Rahnella aquatilis]AZP48848.1 Gfo/Idh/MocA family oxidoreductase [Rahnella aquatilis]AZP53283.1 Gfo/Idh/MocA family oxidoreductase [Rahnella aquatilis]CAH0140582.1 scyllo-inositol 2-dehydrogenase (NAD(+)) [Rahnella aquatilis]
MKTLQAAVIGCGSIHTCHVAAIRHEPDCQLRAIAECDIGKGRALAQEYGCDFYTDYHEMLCDPQIDVVHICLPHHLHKEAILAALAAGKHVFTEKPVALNIGEVSAIKLAASQAAGLTGVCYQNRLNPSSQKIKTLLESGQLGNMLSIKAILTWSRSGAYYSESLWRGRFATEGGSLLINQAIHTLDLMQWFGGGVLALKGVVERTFLSELTENEDTAMVSLKMGNGAHGLFYATNCHSTDSPLLLEIHCEKGLLQLYHNVLWLIEGENKTLLISDDSPSGTAKSYWGDSHRQAVSNFYHSVRHPEEQNYISVSQAEVSLNIVGAIYRSSQSGKWITLAD